ncbi:MAG: hypothetical protein LBD23_19170, partial [Oscillospiraceae bacterium]|nr:hypothetical protein [Oscillospiraceae bacterium]
MKLSYKTSAWPKLTWSEHCELAEAMELNGLELCFSPAESSDFLGDIQLRQQFLRRLSEKQLDIACITVSEPDSKSSNTENNNEPASNIDEETLQTVL